MRRNRSTALLWDSLRGRRGTWRRLVAWSTVQALPAFLSGRLVAHAIDDGFLAGHTTVGFAWLAGLGAAVVVGAIATRQTFLALAALVEPLRDELVERAVRGSLRRSTRAGAAADTAAVARLAQHVEIVRDAYAAVLNGVQGFVVISAGALLGLATLMPALLVVVLVPLVVGVGLFLASLRRIAARQRASILAEERIAESASALAGGLRDVTACGGERLAAAAVGEHVDVQARATRELARFTAVRILVVVLGGWLPIVGILAGGSWLIGQGATIGVIVGALTYVSQGVQPALQMLVRQLGGAGLWLIVTLARILEATDDADARPGGPSPAPWPIRRRGGVRLSGVTFAYGPYAEPVIKDLDLHVPEGEQLAVVGPSGVGKSTLAGLITGVLEPQAGVVRLGALPLQRLDPGDVVAHRVLIPQEAYVFEGTLRENLAYLRPEVPHALLDHAAGVLGARPLVQRLGGYDAPVRRTLLSAGERQLVALVRAYVSTARLVVLDEATCHLDAATETRVEAAFARRPGTVIVIAHRISSALRADRVLVLDGGQARIGRHEELLAESALYRDLVGHWAAGASPVSG